MNIKAMNKVSNSNTKTVINTGIAYKRKEKEQNA